MLSLATLRNLFSKRSSATSETKSPSSQRDVKVSYDELLLGVWRVLVVKDSRFSLFNFQWKSISGTFPMLRRALYDVYSVSPRLFGLNILVQIWLSIEEPLSIYFTNNLFFLIERRISEGFGNGLSAHDLYKAVLFKVACSLFSGFMTWTSRQIREVYSSRVKYEFESRVFSVKVARDLPTAQEHSSSTIDTDDVYYCLDQGLSLLKSGVSFLLHLRLIASIIGTGLYDGGPVFLAICMLPPAITHFTSDELWTKAYVAQPANNFYIRKSALGKLAEADLKQEVMAGGVGTYLINEYRKAQAGLGNTSDSRAESLFQQNRQALSAILVTMCADGPLLYFAFMALFSPSKLSIVQLAVLQQASTSLRYTFESLAWSVGLWPGTFSRMLNLYGALDTQNKMKDGETPYPRPGYEASVGMAIEVRNVSFTYPNTKSERNALCNVSFTIKPGQLVVIVGANGSGKSTIIKLLSRFYDAASGSILVDGIPIQEYKMEALRNGIAMLTQEHRLFPLSVGENIKLGSSDEAAMNDERMVGESARAAGAEGLVKNLSDGYDTVLEPISEGYLSYGGRGNKELEAIHKEMAKPTNISGGEKQRLVAARTFMRLFTCPIKLVTVDEPSSALDPEGEYQLFANLRETRNGRTMIFVTHRFGHLTKYAGLIVCIKEGEVVETGTHTDLLAKGGEYAHLYNVQAQAFAST